MVVEELRLPRLPVGTPRSLNVDFIDSRSALARLCLTSRRFYGMAEPLLYESIALTKDTQFVQLFHALLVKRDRRSWIRSLACPMSITYETDNLQALPVWNRLIAPCKATDLDQREKLALLPTELGVGRTLEEDEWDGGEFELPLCDELLAIILRLTTHLDDILLQIPTDQEPHLDDWLLHLAHTLSLSSRMHPSGVLKSLRSVRAQPTRLLECKSHTSGYREIRPRNVVPGRHDPAFGIDPLCLRAFEMDNVEAVEYCGDNGVWFKLLKPDHGPWTDEK